MLAAITALGVLALGQNAPMPAVVPHPLSMKSSPESFTLNDKTIIVSTGPTGRMLQSFLSPSTGFPFDVRARGDRNAIHLKKSKDQKLGPEGYRLNVDRDRVTIEATTEAGLFYGVQTLRQLLPSDIFRRAKVSGREWTVAGVKIEDAPRFKWRGSMLDVSRHFMPKEFVMKYIDLLAMHKLNTFHWHLTDDQGWRIEIKKYPKLTEVGAWRKDTMTKYSPPEYTGKPHGGYYTQDDVREIVAYAAERHITIVPEIEMPGHAQAAIAAYPWLGNDPLKQLEVGTKWGVIENVFNVDDTTIKFLQDVLQEVMDLFPGQFIHIGGDECPKVQWRASEKAQSKMKALGLKDEHELQSWFIRQMDQFIAFKGRRLIGWSEILEGGLAEKAALMVWLGNDGAMTAVSSGHDVVMAQTTHMYFDYYQSRDRANEPWAIGGFLPLEQVYSYEPILPQMTADQAKHVMGVQYQIWTEYISNGKHVEYMAFPRACAMSEVAWSAKENRNFDRFKSGLPAHLDRLKAFDVNYRKLDPPAPKPAAQWRSGETSETFTTKTWDVSQIVTAPGRYRLAFQYSGGAHRLDIEWAELLENGKSVAKDVHEGRTGGEDNDNEYILDLPSFTSGAKYEVRASIRSDGGTDSKGEIYFAPYRPVAI